MNDLRDEDLVKTPTTPCDVILAQERTQGARSEPNGRRMIQRRRAVRWRSDREALCRPVGGAGKVAWCPAQLRDISAGGAGLLLSGRFEPGTVLDVRFQAVGPEFPQELRARVVHISPMRHGGWALGCQLTPGLTDRQLHALLLGR